MNKALIGLVTLCTMGLYSGAWAAESATPEEIVGKVQEAAAMVADKGEEGLQELDKKESPWVWKDTYVFAYNCDDRTVAAHPMSAALIGKSFDEIKDKKGNAFFDALCEAGKKDKGGWVEYWWSKPGEEGDFRKISYAYQVKGTPYQVGAGIYDDKVTVDELNAMLK